MRRQVEQFIVVLQDHPLSVYLYTGEGTLAGLDTVFVVSGTAPRLSGKCAVTRIGRRSGHQSAVYNLILGRFNRTRVKFNLISRRCHPAKIPQPKTFV